MKANAAFIDREMFFTDLPKPVICLLALAKPACHLALLTISSALI
jgi:hypothetical protein